jgi:Endonuclease NucS
MARPKGTLRSAGHAPARRPLRVVYTGRLTARLPEAVRLLSFKSDGSFLVHDDAEGYRPLNSDLPGLPQGRLSLAVELNVRMG